MIPQFLSFLGGSLLALTASTTLAQRAFIIDQQSSTDETPFPGLGGPIQSAIPPWGQSFTPGLPSIGFIRLLLDDGNVPDGLGATVYVNLRSGSISGPIIGTTAPVTMQNNFAGTATFPFQSAVPLVPGTTYYFEPVQQSGGTWNIVGGEYPYAGGSEWSGGFPLAGVNLWFREGIIVPEPSGIALALLAVAAPFLSRRFSARRRSPQ